MLFFLALTAFLAGCKRTATVEVPKTLLHAKSATLEELVDIVNQYNDIQALRVRIRAEYTSQMKDNDQIELEKYPRAPGYVLFKRPDTTYLVIQNPVLKKKEISFLSEGDDFRVWIHGKQKFYIGKNSSKDLVSEALEENPKIPIRAAHIFQAILLDPISVSDPGCRISRIETQDENRKYYILTIYQDEGSVLLRPLREIHIERVNLTISRQRIFDAGGRIKADISYENVGQTGKYTFPDKMHMERPLDGYSLELELSEWAVDPVINDDLLKLEPPPGVDVIQFK